MPFFDDFIGLVIIIYKCVRKVPKKLRFFKKCLNFA